MSDDTIPIIIDYVVNNKHAMIRLKKGYYDSIEASTLFNQLKNYDAHAINDGINFLGTTWESERKAIQIADSGVPLYDYPGSRATHTESFTNYPVIEQLRHDLLSRTGYQLNSMLYSSYTKNAMLDWSSDKDIVARSPIISWSFGFPRRFCIRTKDNGHTMLFDDWLESGDLLILEGDCQELIEYCVPKLTETENDQTFHINITGRTVKNK
jgi:hypothetical protein